MMAGVMKHHSKLVQAHAFAALGLLLAACSQSAPEAPPEEQGAPAEAPRAAPAKLSADDVKPIVTALAYKQELSRFCGETDDTADDFIDGLSGELKARARVWRGIVAEEFKGAEAEYVCTPEMFEEKAEGAEQALKAWKKLK